MAQTQDIPGGFTPKFHWRVLGTPAPVFPGFEIDICDRISDDEQPDAVWHRERARAILKAHPDVKDLFGRSWTTAIFCVGLAALQISLAISMAWLPWWALLLTAYFLGAIINMALFNLAHECNHSLIFKSKAANRWLFTLTSLPMFYPGHHTWWIEHHVHHNHLGSKKDFVKRRRSILLAFKDRIFGYYPGPKVRRMTTWLTTPLFWPIAAFMLFTQLMRAIVGLIAYFVSLPFTRSFKPNETVLAILADEHLVSGYHRYKLETWAVTYPLASLSMFILLYAFFGWAPLIYLFVTALFTTGFLHPLVFGLILSNSHFHGHNCYQPSSSNYGPINWITFNFGLHTEHHDFHYIPWFRLPKLRKLAPEFYDNLLQTNSYAGLALKFAFGTREAFNNEEYRNLEMLNANGNIARNGEPQVESHSAA
ncbi:MAG TPA: fatty acid desaturase [Pirellulaceae bacterium]|nr:fatty acid desaturase [Pirellulaceae bacterium]HMO91586.1 fatty acid desaturase [Pirellulaceae bacterium]HMP68283.1 fatty acid desaturase [Pirellulaceae bacterium]